MAGNTSKLWMSDYDAALKQAAAENKPVLVSISGLEWCGWCMKLDEEVFSRREFVKYAKSNLICVLLDFDSSGHATKKKFAEQHEALLKKYQVRGFPTVIILDSKGKVIKQTGYQEGGAEKYVEMISSVIGVGKAK